MPNDKWNIQNNPQPNPQLGNDLNGVKIEKTSSGYRLVGVLATTTSTSPPFSFTVSYYDGQSWTINVTTLPASGDGSGNWAATPATVSTGAITGDTTDGDFTAQAGGGADEDAAEEASSAGA